MQCLHGTIFLLITLAIFPPNTHQLDIDSCHQPLGLEDGRLLDSALSASSSYDEASVGPKNARLHSDSSGGAWCPSKPVSRDSENNEFLEIDLGSMHVISKTLTQGRFGNGRGQEYAEAYKIQYWRPGMVNFIDYRDSLGRMILPGNTNTYAVANNSLSPPIFASKVRLLPHSDHLRTVCMRVELVGCPFQEGVVSYSIPQGMVRGASLELMDHTFDGIEDSQTGDLRGGLGQLVDGKYGWDNFKATAPGGQIKGYDWLGWKKKLNSETLNLVFTFDTVRTFHRVDIHTNNHFSKDIQIFRKAKIYFSNEEDKFGDDRSVEFRYMPDLSIENARNVSINLKEEHGQYIMIQLFFAAKWILVSEVTFVSEPRKERLFTTIGAESQLVDTVETSDRMKIEPKYSNHNFTRITTINSTNTSDQIRVDIHNEKLPATIENAYDDVSSPTVGVVIGVLLTVISMLAGGILYVVYRNKRAGKGTPTHSLLSRKQTGDTFGANMSSVGNVGDPFKETYLYTPYGLSSSSNGTSNNKATLYVPIPLNQVEESIYEEPLPKIYSGGFLSLNRKFGSDPVLSEDCTDEYAEPSGIASNSFSENIYSRALEPPTTTKTTTVTRKMSASALPPLPINHYARPLSPPRPPPPKFLKHSQPKLVLPPPPPGSSLLMSGTGTSGTSTSSRSPPRPPLTSSSSSSSPSSTNSAKPSRRKTAKSSQGTSDRKRKNSSNNLTSIYDQGLEPQALAELYARLEKNSADILLLPKPTRSTSIDTVNVVLQEINRSKLNLLEKLGEGQFGEIHLCQINPDTPGLPSDLNTHLVAVKSLRKDCDDASRSDFEHEARILTSLSDPNLVRVLGVCFTIEPICMICEYTERGDLCQFLQDHVAETSLSKSPGVPTLSYGCLIYLATQIASGMKYLESLNFVHRDLAARNCLVGHNNSVKISDYGMSRSLYKNDYYRSPAGCLLPIRWMAWESVLMGKFTTKSDVWSFGVTLWEILTFAREQPHESLSDERVISNLSRLYETKGRPASNSSVGLPTPFQCPREVRDLMNECWQRDESERPSFREIHLFLQRKNLGYDPLCDLESADVTITKECDDMTSATDGDDYDDIDADADDDLQ